MMLAFSFAVTAFLTLFFGSWGMYYGLTTSGSLSTGIAGHALGSAFGLGIGFVLIQRVVARRAPTK